MPEFEWTDRLLNIPAAAAARHARPGTLRFDEIRSEAAFMMVYQARYYRAGRGMSPETYCFRAARAGAARMALALAGVAPPRRDVGNAGHEARWARHFRRLEGMPGMKPACRELRPGALLEAGEELAASAAKRRRK